MQTLRTTEGEERYREYRKIHNNEGDCALCSKQPLRAFTYWKIMGNDFPYDLIAQTHHMLVSNRHVTEPELSGEELDEFKKIKESVIHKEYDYLIEATHNKKSIPGHFHIHLIIAK